MAFSFVNIIPTEFLLLKVRLATLVDYQELLPLANMKELVTS